MEEVLIPLIVFSSIFGVFYVFLTTRNKERLSMIEKGADASMFLTKKQDKGYTLKFGMLAVGVAIGLLVGSIIAETTTLPEQIAYVSMTFLFGGAFLIGNHYIELNKK
ncbi:MAG: hypothetical protein CO023_00560 [Flavobacteriales bacterium CG_4_9_14_0_2_um_filter_35_242]|nr:hypothetical protein [Zetaproteobacteria bacterium]NDK17779.1 hypothetical protein [Flavobacteriales bacterium]PIR14838.1 MAG: hypothetical protein COV50_00480 [Flavobacteriales bacterium CG11_big_fil_rev_8_21_14_0_20_35_7]PIV18294.1 MAG: hypothetical protein COS42_02175 [Flavobacteriales bacterium CG03_land_8_20_14_0_80_35_15]PIX07205.1 MAG: hypothetical protein COZ76_04760 [Flavobacteriales bacterium CG_4_8_14_3_um_filter_35_10]PJA04601.1 MAG: hypothetical protein COX71_11015 [Flavobacter